MSDKKEMCELQIAAKLKAGKRFSIKSQREQKHVLTAAKYLGIAVTTRASEQNGGFEVFFLQQ